MAKQEIKKQVWDWTIKKWVVTADVGDGKDNTFVHKTLDGAQKLFRDLKDIYLAESAQAA